MNEIKTGDKAFHLLLGTTYEYIVVRVIDAKTIVCAQARHDTSTPIGMDEVYTKRKGARWVEKGKTERSSGYLWVSSR